MNKLRCECGDSECSVCGYAQGTKTPTQPIRRTVYSRKALFCCAGCADSFRGDRKTGLIYPAMKEDSGDFIDWEGEKPAS
jgi:hypothetical protein